jgi:RNA polymerase sigma-70 factor (ECF subfamily)
MLERLTVLAGIADAPGDPYDAVWVKSAVERLKPALRDTVVLVAGQQLTHAEAAAVLGVSENTVSWRMHEARRILSGG